MNDPEFIQEITENVDEKFITFIKTRNLSEDGMVYHLSRANNFAYHPKVHFIQPIVYEYDANEKVYVRRINMFGERYAFAGNPLLANTIYIDALVNIYTDTSGVMSKTSHYSKQLHGLSPEQREELMEYLKTLHSEREIQAVINTSNLFHMVFKSDMQYKQALKK